MANNAGGRTSETFTMYGARPMTVQLVEYTGIMAAGPLDKVTAKAGTGWTVSTTTTATTAQAKELLITGFAANGTGSYSAPTNSFVEVLDTSQTNLGAAVHERIVSATGAYGHQASFGAYAPWVGLTATFRSSDTSAFFQRTPDQLWTSNDPNAANLLAGRLSHHHRMDDRLLWTRT